MYESLVSHAYRGLVVLVRHACRDLCAVRKV